MATTQTNVATGARPAGAQGPPPQAMVLQHPQQLQQTLQQQQHLMPVMPGPAAAHFAQGGNFAQIPLQHQRPMMNGLHPGPQPMPPGPHPNFQGMHPNAAMAALARQQQMRQVQNPGMAPNTLNQMTPYQPPLHAALHPQQLQQLQHFQQQANPGMRMNPQPQMIPQHLLQQQQTLAGAQIQVMNPGQPGPQQTAVVQRPPIMLLQFTQFALQLSSPQAGNLKKREGYWNKFVKDWFAPLASVRIVLGEGGGRKEYELPNQLIPHFFHSVHTSGVRQMHIILNAPQAETQPHIIEFPNANVLYRLENGSQVIWDGPVKAQFRAVGQELKIEHLELVNDEFVEYVPRNVNKQTLTPPSSKRSTSPDTKRSPLDRGLHQMNDRSRANTDEGEERMTLPKSDINEMGLPTHLMSFLEVAEICVYIQPLIEFSRKEELSPRDALLKYTSTGPKPQFQQMPKPLIYQQQQVATPMNEMSPMAANAVLPQVAGVTSSPQPLHYPSPMSSQTSQQGASGPSTTPLLANRQVPGPTTPKIPQTNKRRRGSAVANTPLKEEDEDPMNNPPQKLPKASPRMSISRGGAANGPAGKRIRGES